MTTYLDAPSLAPTPELASKRCYELGINGTVLLDPGDLTEGDTLVCGPLAVKRWQEEAPYVRVISIAQPDKVVQLGSAQEQPYKWHLFDSAEHGAAVDLAFRFCIKNGLPIGVDVETDSIDDGFNEMTNILVGVGVAFGDECYYGEARDEKWMGLIGKWLPHVRWVGANAKYDRSVLRHHGVMVDGVAGDSMLAAYLTGRPRAALKPLVWDRYGYRMITYEDVVGSGKNRKRVSAVDPKVIAEYCSGDAYFCLKLEADLRAELDEQRLAIYRSDLALIPIIGSMQEVGMPIDREKLTKALDNAKEEACKYEFLINILAEDRGYTLSPTVKTCKSCRNGKKKRLTCKDCNQQGKFEVATKFNPNSTKQLLEYFYDHEGEQVQALTDKGKPSIDALALLRIATRGGLAAPVAHATFQLRQVQKFIGYAESWLKWSARDGKIHTVFTLANTDTGRHSSENPNLQQVKLDWREFFVAPEGRELIVADFSQIEVRIPSGLSKDPELLSIVNAPSDTIAGDFHGQNLQAIFGIPYEEQGLPHNKPYRTRAKNYGFGAFYGSKGYEVQEVIEKAILKSGDVSVPPPSLKEIMHAIDVLHNKYGVFFKEWIPAALEACRENGGYAYTIYGRPRYIPDIFSKDKAVKGHAERACLSHIIQGSAGDILRKAEHAVYRYTKAYEMDLHLTVHDELVISASNARYHVEAIREIMGVGQPLMPRVPLVVDVSVGKNWRECHK